MVALYEEEIFERYAGKNVLLDSNLLLLLVSASADIRLLRSIKRIAEFAVQDYDLLVRFLKSFRILVTTPHILTEVSNLAKSLSGSYRRDFFNKLAALIHSNEHDSGVKERWTPALILASLPEFSSLGITDCALGDLAFDALVVTADYRLSGVLRNRGIPVLNFRDLRAIEHSLQ